MSALWVEKRSDLEGSRWSVWEKYYSGIIEWDLFKDQVLKFNPHINVKTRWVFVKGWEYTMPKSSSVSYRKEEHKVPDFDHDKERNKFAQQLLIKDNSYNGGIDGIIGRKSLMALSNYNIDPTWPNSRKIIGFLQLKAVENGIDTGKVDGFWGQLTEYAIEKLHSLISTGKTEAIWRPEENTLKKSKNDWPIQYSDEFYDLFGNKGKENLVKTILPYEHRLSWDLTAPPLQHTYCHHRVKESYQKVLSNVLEHYGHEKVKELRLDIFGGCFNDRPMRGGRKPSMHSWGIAMDYDPINNKLKWGRDRAHFAHREYDAWWQFWEDEGWVSLGRHKNFDWMHIQAAKLP